jgi:hypothetical protein
LSRQNNKFADGFDRLLPTSRSLDVGANPDQTADEYYDNNVRGTLELPIGVEKG